MKRLIESFIESTRSPRKTLPLLLIIASLTIVLSAFSAVFLSSFYTLRVPNVGTIHTIGVQVFWDASLENKAKEIQWGTIYPGSSTNVTLYVQSISNVESVLKLQTANWVFLNSTDNVVSGPNGSTPYMALNWDYNNAPITPREAVRVTLTLFTKHSLEFIKFLIDNDVKNFGFDIIILAVEAF